MLERDDRKVAAFARVRQSDRPTRADIAGAVEYWDNLERGQARYAIVYADGEPSEIYFAGYSFD